MWTVDPPLICCQFAVSWSLRKSCCIPPHPTTTTTTMDGCFHAQDYLAMQFCICVLYSYCWIVGCHQCTYVYVLHIMYCLCKSYYPSSQLMRRNHISQVYCSFGGLFVVIYIPCCCILLFLMYVNKQIFERRLWVSTHSYCLALQYQCAKIDCCDRWIVLVSLQVYSSCLTAGV